MIAFCKSTQSPILFGIRIWFCGTYRSGSDLLQSILALGVAGVSHDDHDDWHVFVYKCQGTMLQLPGQDALRVHVSDLLDFLH